jgi:DNA-binding IclR family transcriptional regulator
MHVVQSIERAFGILRALAVAPAGISELAQVVDLPKSTVARILHTLEQVGAIDRIDGSGSYRIGSGIGELARSSDVTAALVVSVRPFLARLAGDLGEAAGFSIPEGHSMHYLVQVDSPNPIQVRDYTGVAVPMHVGSAGVVMMAHWPAEELDRYLARPLEQFTSTTVVDRSAVVDRLATVRRDGFAWVHGEFAEGLSSVAAPVYDGWRVMVGAITVHGPSYRFPGERDPTEVGSRVKRAADRFSSNGGSPDGR